VSYFVFVVKIMDKKFTISLESRYAELWRYNIVVTCGCFDEVGERINFLSKENFVAAVGSNLDAAPEGIESHNKLVLTTSPCANIVAYIYLIPHSLPPTRDVEEYAPFDLRVKVSADDGVIYDTNHKINQWSGCSMELKLPQAK
jgi:hypothetical protein